MESVSKSPSEDFSFSSAVLTFTFDQSSGKMYITSWGRQSSAMSDNFWEDVRKWFNSHNCTSIRVAKAVADSSFGGQLVDKLQGTDMYSKGVPSITKVTKTVEVAES